MLVERNCESECLGSESAANVCCRLHGKSKANKTKVKPKGSDGRTALDGLTLAGYQCWGNVALADSGVEIQWADSGKTKVMV